MLQCFPEALADGFLSMFLCTNKSLHFHLSLIALTWHCSGSHVDSGSKSQSWRFLLGAPRVPSSVLSFSHAWHVSVLCTFPSPARQEPWLTDACVTSTQHAVSTLENMHPLNAWIGLLWGILPITGKGWKRVVLGKILLKRHRASKLTLDSKHRQSYLLSIYYSAPS